MEEDSLKETEISEEVNPDENDKDSGDEKKLQENSELPESQEAKEGIKNDYVKQYKKGRKEETDGEQESVLIEHLRQAEINRGMQFAGSHIDNATFIIDNTGHQQPSQLTKEVTVNLLGGKDEGSFLGWCVEHYQDFYFSMLLAACILDRQPYQAIYQMARELQEMLSDSIEESTREWISQSHIVKTLGIIIYTDSTLVRGVELETQFLRLPIHEQAERYIRLMVNEFSELKYILTRYLTEKIIKIYGSNHNYIIISGCMEALAYIGMADLKFFNDQIIPCFLQKRRIGMDYCAAVLLGKLYAKSECMNYVKACAVQWGQLKNNPHNLLASLYICSMLGNQENLVCDIWMNVLDQLMVELTTGNFMGKMSHIDMLQGLFKSGNRDVSYYKGVIHAFHMQISQAEKNWQQDKMYLLNTIFLLFLVEDYIGCNVSGNKTGMRDMMWIGIFQKLDRKTGQELTGLWCRVLDSREYSKECWKLLEDYLGEYQNYDDSDIERLAFFFYHVNQKIGDDQGVYFLKECVENGGKPMQIARQIYKRIKE